MMKIGDPVLAKWLREDGTGGGGGAISSDRGHREDGRGCTISMW
jgi:hypothetical protein